MTMEAEAQMKEAEQAAKLAQEEDSDGFGQYEKGSPYVGKSIGIAQTHEDYKHFVANHPD